MYIGPNDEINDLLDILKRDCMRERALEGKQEREFVREKCIYNMYVYTHMYIQYVFIYT